ncbi:hypothetical protein KCP71_11195 [Salmonella enterica subsp. enterica]|nr:hypothetical protein KCP71_11195 [Salmonella enterica subsp. enterica]
MRRHTRRHQTKLSNAGCSRAFQLLRTGVGPRLFILRIDNCARPLRCVTMGTIHL